MFKSTYSRCTLILFSGLIFDQTALAARAEIKTFKAPAPLFQAQRKGLYGIGAADNSGATIVIVNGNVHVATPQGEKKIQIDNSIQTVASNLTYVNVNLWSEIPVAISLSAPKDLYPLINSTLKKIGYELSGTFPFLLKGTFSKVELKLVSKDQELKYSDRKITGLVVGFFTRKTSTREDAFESSSMMHFVSDDKRRAGVVDTFTIEPTDKISLFLPR